MLRGRSALRFGVAALVCAATAGCVDISAGDARYTDTIDRRFAVSGQPSLTVSTFDGAINVNTWDRPEVVVRIEKRAFDKADADQIQVTAQQNGDAIEVRVQDPAQTSGFGYVFNKRGARLLVTVPGRARIDATTGDGHVGVQAVEGELRLHTGDGSIRLEAIRGTVDATSGDGSIEIDGGIDRLRAKSGDGSVRVRASSPFAGSSTWDISTGDGSVVVELPEATSAELDAATGNGRVRVQGLAFQGESDRRERRSARGRLGNGGGRITIRSGDGSITVRAGT
jgi:hypothetical protein